MGDYGEETSEGGRRHFLKEARAMLGGAGLALAGKGGGEISESRYAIATEKMLQNPPTVDDVAYRSELREGARDVCLGTSAMATAAMAPDDKESATRRSGRLSRRQFNRVLPAAAMVGAGAYVTSQGVPATLGGALADLRLRAELDEIIVANGDDHRLTEEEIADIAPLDAQATQDIRPSKLIATIAGPMTVLAGVRIAGAMKNDGDKGRG